MEAISLQELECLKYPELRKLAKQAGLKANLKADRLLKALKKHFYPVPSPEQSTDDSDVNCTLSDKDELPSCAEKEETSLQHVTNRRDRGKKGNLKESASSETSLTREEAKQIIQTTENEQIQENNETVRDETSRPESLTRQRKRRRTDKDVLSKTLDTKEKCTKINAAPAGKIPRYAGRLSKAGSKVSTPNFKKLHEAHFKKMESIDKYIERKQKRLEAATNTIQEVKMLAKKCNLLIHTENTPNSGSKKLARKSNLTAQTEKNPSGSSKKSLQSKFYLFSPAPQKRHSSPAKTPANRKRPLRASTANKSILADKSEFKPTVLSVSKMNVRFSEATKDNEHKRSLIKTPARKSSCFSTPGSYARKSFPLAKNNPESDACKSLIEHDDDDSDCDANRSLALHKNEDKASTLNQSATTPFKFTAETAATPSTNKKKFDLQASLARPLGYQPHRGKLKPWGQSNENQPDLNSHVSELKSNFKQPPLSSRTDRRRKHEEDRKVKRDKTVGTRRGIIVP